MKFLQELSVLKRGVPKTLAFAFGLRLHSKTRCFKTRVLGRRSPNGKPQERLRFRDLRSKTLAFKKRIAIVFCDLKTSLGARACVQVLCVQKTRRLAFAFLNPLSSDDHRTRLPLGKVHRRTSKKFCAFLEVCFFFYCIFRAGELLRSSFVAISVHALRVGIAGEQSWRSDCQQ